MSYYVHSVPGRLRVKIPMVRCEPGVGREVVEIVENIRGVRHVEVNPVTGSVVVRYDPKWSRSEEILEVLQKHGYFDEQKVLPNDPLMENAAVKASRMIGKTLFGLAVEKAFEGSALSMLAAFI